MPLILLGLRVPDSLEALAEVVVAGMLVGLGGYAIKRAREFGELGQQVRLSVTRSTLPVGLIHGFAGSGAAVVLATTQSDTPQAALVFLGVFVVGSTLSMTAAAGVLSIPLGKMGDRPSRMGGLLGVSGVLSIAVGLYWGGPHVMHWLG